MRLSPPSPPISLAGTESACRFFEACFAEVDSNIECLFVAHLDEHAQCIQLTQHPGTSTGAEFPLRTLLLEAATHGSRGIIVAHNHPSGDHRPSRTDHATTRRCADACAAIDLTLVDHLVFGGGEWSSFRQLGYL